MRKYSFLLLILTACSNAPSDAHIVAERQYCMQQHEARVAAKQPSPMVLWAQCQSQRVMPLFLAARPEKEKQIHAFFAEIETLAAMHDQKRIGAREVESYWQQTSFELLYGDIPECSEGMQANDCILKSPTGQLYRRKATVQNRG